MGPERMSPAERGLEALATDFDNAVRGEVQRSQLGGHGEFRHRLAAAAALIRLARQTHTYNNNLKSISLSLSLNSE